MTQEVARTLLRWREACLKQSGASNEFIVFGRRYRWLPDLDCTGVMYGVILRVGDDGAMTWRAGSFRIAPNGDVLRAPPWLRSAAEVVNPNPNEEPS